MTPRAQTLFLCFTALLAMASLCWAALPILRRITAEDVLPVPSQAFQTEAPRPDLGPVLAFAPFGSSAAPAPTVAADSAPLPTEAGLTLLGITLAAPVKSSRAIIAGGETGVASYTIGAWIAPGVELAGVQESHVVLRVNGRLETLAFPDAASRGASVTSAANGPDLENLFAQPRSLAAPPPPVLEPADAAVAAYRSALQNDPYGFLAGLGLQPDPQGYLVQDSAAPELGAAGLLAGDVIISLNGRPVGNIDTDAALFDQIVAAGRLIAMVRRNGEMLTLTVPLP